MKSSYRKTFLILLILISVLAGGGYWLINSSRNSINHSDEFIALNREEAISEKSHIPHSQPLAQRSTLKRSTLKKSNNHRNVRQENPINQAAFHRSSINEKRYQKLLEKAKDQYFSSLPPYISSELKPVKTLKRGLQVKISLKNQQTGERSSYHALIHHQTGQLLTTWHRPIKHSFSPTQVR